MSDICQEVIQDKKIEEKDQDILAQAFLQTYLNVIKVNLHTGAALILKSDLNQGNVGAAAPLYHLVKRYVQERVYPSDMDRVSLVTLERLNSFCLDGLGFPFEIRARSDTGRLQWVEVDVARIQSDQDHVLLTVCNIDETRLMRSIVDLFVYRNYDYLLLIDSKNDTYTRFTGKKRNTPVPPEKGEHYTADMISYNRKYVVPEDYERVTANMQLENMEEMLEQSDCYSFTSGGITEDGKFRRSRVSFIYYDKTEGLILSARTDVTQIYLEEQEKNRQLADALRSARQDAMTGLYNQKATKELVRRSLESQYRNTAAIFFIDVDNFKMANDTLGHQKGDELLCFLAEHIQEIAGRNGIAGRIGGDEYLLYLPDCLSIEEIERTAQQICQIFDSTPQKDMISCSVGISVYPRDGTGYGTLLHKADQALYTSKRYGKKRYYLYSRETERLAESDKDTILHC